MKPTIHTGSMYNGVKVVKICTKHVVLSDSKGKLLNLSFKEVEILFGV